MRHTKADLTWLLARSKMVLEKRLVLPFRELPTQTPNVYSGVRVTRNVAIPMRDGVRLWADLYEPDAAERPASLPVVLIRLPYGKDEPYCFMPAHGRFWARKGYACVIQDVRGKFRSEGAFEAFRNETDDAYDSIDWLARQPWCSGKVGVTGESYYGHTSWAAARSHHPNLTCIAPAGIGLDEYDSVYEGGAFCLSSEGVWLAEEAGRRYRNKHRIDTRHLPLVAMAAAAGLPSELFAEAIRNPTRGGFWQALDLTDVCETLDIPVFHWSGWYDILLRGVLWGWRDVHGRCRDAATLANQWLVVSPNDHETSPDYSNRIGRLAVKGHGYSYDRVQEFFDYWLRGVTPAFADSKRVRLFVVGANRWREGDAFPLPGTEFVDYYLHGGGVAATLRGDGRLSPEPPGDEPEDVFIYDPARPVDFWHGKDAWEFAAHLGDRRPVEARADVLVYTSPPLASDLEVVGPLSVTLWASSSAPDTDFTAALVDVWPDGYAQVVQEGIQRARFRASDTAPTPIEPGEVYQFTVNLTATGYLFPAGHRLRVEISSSNFDRYDRNPNTGRAFGMDAELRPARQTVYHDARRPSCITLPLIR